MPHPAVWPEARHRGVLVECPDYGTVEIDEEILSLIQQLWSNKITTEFCCQGNKRPITKTLSGYGYIMTSGATFNELLTLLGISYTLQKYVRNTKQNVKRIRHIKFLAPNLNLAIHVESDSPVIRFRNRDIPKIDLVIRNKQKIVWERQDD